MPSANVSAAHDIFSYKIGDFKITALNDGTITRPLEGFLRNATVEEAQRALSESGFSPNALTIPFTPLLAEHAGQRILFDTGLGDFGSETNGFMLRNLKKAGYEPSDITHIIISHFHPDHINGLRLKDGMEVFPDAEILVPQKEWDFWIEANPAETEPEAQAQHRMNAKRVFMPIATKVKKFGDFEEILPGIISLEAPGHTLGHCAFKLSSLGEELLILSDITNHPALFVKHPEWGLSVDIVPDLAVQTRKSFLEKAAQSRAQVCFYHAPFPATGHIVKNRDGFQFIPLKVCSC